MKISADIKRNPYSRAWGWEVVFSDGRRDRASSKAQAITLASYRAEIGSITVNGKPAKI